MDLVCDNLYITNSLTPRLVELNEGLLAIIYFIKGYAPGVLVCCYILFTINELVELFSSI